MPDVESKQQLHGLTHPRILYGLANGPETLRTLIKSMPSRSDCRALERFLSRGRAQAGEDVR